MMNRENMIGARLVDVLTVMDDATDQIREVRLITDKGTFVAYAEADCCGVAWIDEVQVGTAIGGTIIGVNTVGTDQTIGEFDEVRDSFTEVVSTTNGDMAMFTFCEHNGYYSGWIVWEKR